MAVWVVRGGRRREQEEEALASGVLAIGYGLSEDLSDTRTIEDVKSLLRQKDPNAADGSIGSDASRLWNFKENIKIGDLVVMPRKGQSTTLHRRDDRRVPVPARCTRFVPRS